MPRRVSSNVLRDWVYRAIFRLEAGKRDAADALCRSLRIAWLDEGGQADEEFQRWLKRVTPMCLALISTSGEAFADLTMGGGGSADQAPTRKGNSMHIKVEQAEGVRFIIQARNHTVVSDQPQENGGDDLGMTPPELLLASLGSCAAYYAAEYLRNRGLGDSGVQVTVDADKLRQPARLGNFQIDVSSPANLTEEQREAMTRAVRHCLVHNTLLSSPEIAINVTAFSQQPVG